MKRFILLIASLFFGTISYAQTNPEPPLKLTISADKESYSVGDEIKINYTIENVSSEAVGFYLGNYYTEGFKIAITDLSGHPFMNNKFVEPMPNFLSPSLCPTEYRLLLPNEALTKKGTLQFQYTEVSNVGAQHGMKSPKVLFISSNDFFFDGNEILIPTSSDGKVKISSTFKISVPSKLEASCKTFDTSLTAWGGTLTSNDLTIVLDTFLGMKNRSP